MFFNRIFVLSISFLLTFVASSPCLAVDINNDGQDDLFIYQENTERVLAYTTRGEYVAQIGVPRDLTGNPTIIYPGESGGEIVIFTLDIVGTNQEATLYRFDTAGGQLSKDLGVVKNSAIMVYDIDGDRESDIVKVEKSGQTEVIFRPFTTTEQTVTNKIPALKRNSLATVTNASGDPYIVIYTPAAKKRRTNIVLHPILAGSRQKFRVNRKIKSQLYPIVADGSLVQGQFVTFKKRANGTITKYQHIDAFAGRSKNYSVPASSTLIPGYYEGAGSNQQLLSISGSGKIYDIAGGGALLAELDLNNLPGPPASQPTPVRPTPTPVPNPGINPTPAPGGPTPIPTVPPGGPLPPQPPIIIPTPTPAPTPTPLPTPMFGCSNTYPTALMLEINAAYQAGNFLLLQAKFREIEDLNLCNEIYTRVQAEIDAMFNRSLVTARSNKKKKKKRRKKKKRKRKKKKKTRRTNAVISTAATRSNVGTILGAPLISLISSVNSGGGGNNPGGGGNNPGDVGCDKSQSSIDGPGGFVLKESENDGKLVLLLPSKLSTSKTQLANTNGEKIEDLRFTGRSNPDNDGRKRETWRGSKVPEQYPKQLIVKAFVSPVGNPTAKRTECFIVENSHIRND